MSLLYSIGNVAARLRSLTGLTLLRALQAERLCATWSAESSRS